MTLKELTDDFFMKVFNLGEGFDRKFIENPGFASSIKEARNTLSFLEISDDLSNIQVNTNDNSIYFESKLSNKEIEWKLERVNGNSFRVTAFVHKLDRKHKAALVRNITYKESINDVNENKVIIEGEQALLIYKSLDDKKCEISNSGMVKIYNSYGIHVSTRHEGYRQREYLFNKPVNDIKALDLLKQSYSSCTWRDLILRIRIDRKYLDVADIYYEDSIVKYEGPMKLKTDNGLREMIPEQHTIEEIEINPLTSEEINSLLDTEINETIINGLIKYTEGRTKYHYNSIENSGFVYVIREKPNGINV